MADSMRGLRWRAALTAVALVLVIMWYGVFSGRGYVVRIDFTYAMPDAIGAEVLVDGEVVDTLAMLRRQPINGIEVSGGDHVVALRSDRCEGRPFEVVRAEREPSVSLFVHLIEQTIDRHYVCTLALRR